MALQDRLVPSTPAAPSGSGTPRATARKRVAQGTGQIIDRIWFLKQLETMLIVLREDMTVAAIEHDRNGRKPPANLIA
jgi:hypothetical protein